MGSLETVVPGSEFAGAVPGGKAALGLVIAKVNKKIREECSKGNREKSEFYEKLREKLTKIYKNMKEDKERVWIQFLDARQRQFRE